MLNKELFQEGRNLFKKLNSYKLTIYFNELLSQIIANDYLYDKTYFHPLGFIYSELIEFENRDTLRLNVWNDVRLYQEPRMEIHNHFYEFYSFVLKGRMTNRIYQIVNSDAPDHAAYTGSYDKVKGRTLRKTAKTCSVTLHKIQEIDEGKIYYLPPDTYHSSYSPVDIFTCTFLYAFNRGTPNSTILGPIDGLNEYYSENRLVDKATIDGILKKLVRI